MKLKIEEFTGKCLDLEMRIIFTYTGCPVDFYSLKNGDQIACMPSNLKIPKILKGLSQLGFGIFGIFEKY